MTHNKNKLKKRILAPLMVLLAALALPTLLPGLPASAASQEAAGEIGYYVRALLPENQLDPALTYFDLRMQPGQKQQLAVEVVNEGSEAITVDVAAISASTNRNGIIDYKTPDIRDKTLRHPFSELARLEASSLAIPPGSTQTAQVNLTMPKESYDGVVLGGLAFTRRPQGEAPPAEGMTLQNIYSYVIGVKLSETDTPIQPDFELESVEAEAVNAQPAMVHSIRNKKAAIAKGVRLRATVRDSSGAIVAREEGRDIDMAPNSLMPLALTPAELTPGEYTSSLTLEHEGKSWSFEQTFTVGGAQAEEINTALPAAQSTALPIWVILALLLAAALVTVLLVSILALARRRKKENAPPGTPYKKAPQH